MEIKMVSIADVPLTRSDVKYGEVYSKIPSITKGMALGVTLGEGEKVTSLRYSLLSYFASHKIMDKYKIMVRGNVLFITAV
ncbi:MAG: hypothetical protein IPJ03_22190 [Ignavibacteriales bacterium]|nr:hypothetical protein [Ignavibacteriales bacterium]MBK7381652.1 hypothetical protein [Ignavibacteriales bacterium]